MNTFLRKVRFLVTKQDLTQTLFCVCTRLPFQQAITFLKTLNSGSIHHWSVMWQGGLNTFFYFVVLSCSFDFLCPVSRWTSPDVPFGRSTAFHGLHKIPIFNGMQVFSFNLCHITQKLIQLDFKYTLPAIHEVHVANDFNLKR